MKKTILNILGLLALALGNTVVAGNFHYQIDVMTRLLGDQNGQLDTVQMSWFYDEKISSILLQDEDLTPAKRQESLNTVANLIMTDLKGLNYFTQLQLNGKPVKVTNIGNYSVELIEDKYLRLLFSFSLAQPVDAKGSKLSISLADPNGAAMLFYNSAERIVMDESVPAKCNINLVNFDEVEHGKAAQRVYVSCK